MSVTNMQRNCTINQSAYVCLLIDLIHSASDRSAVQSGRRPVLGDIASACTGVAADGTGMLCLVVQHWPDVADGM